MFYNADMGWLRQIYALALSLKKRREKSIFSA